MRIFWGLWKLTQKWKHSQCGKQHWHRYLKIGTHMNPTKIYEQLKTIPTESQPFWLWVFWDHAEIQHTSTRQETARMVWQTWHHQLQRKHCNAIAVINICNVLNSIPSDGVLCMLGISKAFFNLKDSKIYKIKKEHLRGIC